MYTNVPPLLTESFPCPARYPSSMGNRLKAIASIARNRWFPRMIRSLGPLPECYVRNVAGCPDTGGSTAKEWVGPKGGSCTFGF